MWTRRLFVTAGCLTVLGVFIAGCAPTVAPIPTLGPAALAKAPVAETPALKPALPTPTPKLTSMQPRHGGLLTRTHTEDPPHLDVHQGTTAHVLLPLANVYNGLVRLDPVEVNKVVPDLAEKWDVSLDGRTYTFHLRKGVKWHDGKPFTSEDAKFSLERMAFWKEHKIISPRGGALLSAVDKVEIVDASTVRVALKYPNASFLGNAASGWVLMLPKHVIEAKGDMKKDAIGTGPFKWKAWNFGVSEEMVRNADYFVSGLPYLDGIKVYIIKDDATRFAVFRTGRAHMTGIGSKALTPVQAEMVRKDMADSVTVITHPTAARYQLFMNLKRKPWDDIRVRQTVEMAYDRKEAIAINHNVGVVGAAMHPRGAWGIPEEEMGRRPGYRQPNDADVARARSLLAEAGYPQGFKAKLLARSGGAAEQQGVVAKDQLAKIGISLTLDVKELTVLYGFLQRRDFELSLILSSDPGDDPDTTLSAYYVTNGSMNHGEFSDKKIDELFQKQAAMLDEKQRRKVVEEIQHRILDQVVYPVIFWDVANLGFWKEVRGYVPGFGPFTHNNLDHVWLSK